MSGAAGVQRHFAHLALLLEVAGGFDRKGVSEDALHV
jgi:hypothetical protein